ncbi:protein phosphatase regulator REG1 [Sporobolomyces salmoneus]|uniref:protein phosphatase regulator REG1 n=1 Tax=Sporobolomyces salmoneus TaxID=183962 RepID=UPI00317C8E71
MASVLSSPTPSFPSGSVPIVTPPLLDSPSEMPPSSSSPSSSSNETGSQPSTPTSSTSSSVNSQSHSHSNVVPAYPYNVAMAPSSFGGGPVPDDSEITTRLPSICVDYLSHDWAEDDVWTSWKAMTRHKSEIANGVRLENASWRTWAKQRGKLKTISPETLNWLKDSDVTWLYGPLHTAVEAVPPPKVASANDRLGLEPLRPFNKEGGTPKKAATLPAPTTAEKTKIAAAVAKKENPAAVRLRRKSEPKTKPILKYRSLSDILMPQGQPTSPNLEQLGMDLEDQATISVHHARSDSHLVRLNSLNRKTRASPAHSPAGSSPERGASDSSSSTSYFFQQAATKKKERRHISFNHRVEQCIAIDSTDEVARTRHYGSTASSSSSSDDDEDDVLTFGSSPRHLQLPLKGEQEPHTIARLGPTTLKSIEVYPAPSPAVVYQDDEDEDEEMLPAAAKEVEPPTPVSTHESRSGGGGAGATSGAALLSGNAGAGAGVTDQQAAGQRAMFDYSSGGGNRPAWDPEDEDDYAMGFDYFTGGGPDIGIGDEYDMASYGPAHLVGGTHNGYQGGSVAQNSSYLGHGPYSPTSPYAPGNGGPLDPSSGNENVQTIPHYRDNESSSTRGPYSPPSAREAPSPKRSAMKGARNREPSAESDLSSHSQSPSSPSLSNATSPTVAVATAIPSHVRPSTIRRTSSEERPPTTERGRSASRGSSSSLERAASADRRTSTSISPSSSYSPPSNAAVPISAAAKPISIQPSQRLGSYESLGSVGSAAMGAGGGSTSRMPDVPEVSPQSEAPYKSEEGGGGGSNGNGNRSLNIMTSSSVDSFNSFGMPTTPTSPVASMSSPSGQRFQSFNADDDDDDDARVEDVDAFPATIDDTKEDKAASSKSVEPVVSAPPPAIPSSSSLPTSTSTSSLEVHAPVPTHSHSHSHSNSNSSIDGPGHGRTPSGPRLRNPSPSNPTTSTTNEEGHGHPSSSSEHLVKSASSTSLDRLPSRDDSRPSSSTLTEDQPLSTQPADRKPSFARRSLLRAARASSEQGREQSPPALARSASEGANSSQSTTRTSTPNIDGEYSFGYDEDAGKGIDVAGTARDLLGAISKGIWGSLGGRSSSSRS